MDTPASTRPGSTLVRRFFRNLQTLILATSGLIFYGSILLFTSLLNGFRRPRNGVLGEGDTLESPLTEASVARMFEIEDQEFMTIGAKASAFRPPPDSTKVKIFQYSPLPGPKYIRLLKRVDAEDPYCIMFDLIVVPLESAVDAFVAISYCWGTDKPTRLLPLSDGSHIPVTENVEDLLANIFPEEDDYIWLDVVCINQRDNVEKGQQVQMMRDIYASARRVSVWLGKPESPADSTASNTTEGSSDSGDDTSDGDDLDEEYKAYWECLQEYGKIAKGEEINNEVMQNGLAKFAELVKAPWWRRVWIVQEVCYGRRVWFHYGRLVLAMRLLQKMFDAIAIVGWDVFKALEGDGDRPRVAWLFRGDMTLEAIESIRTTIPSEGPPMDTLEHMYGRLYYYQATDPRDRIFALLGLVDEESYGQCLRADYETGIRDVFTHSMGAIMSNTKDFATLGHAGIATRRTRYPGQDELPSWVPDFAMYNPHSNFSGSVHFYRAASEKRPLMTKPGAICSALADPELDKSRHDSLQHAAPCPVQPRKPRCPAIHKDILMVYGAKIDVVAGCGLDSGPEIDEMSNLGFHANPSLLLEFLEDALRAAGFSGSYPTGEAASEVAARTLIANNLGNMFKPEKPDAPIGPLFDTVLELLRDEVRRDDGSESHTWQTIAAKAHDDETRKLVRMFGSAISDARAGLERKLFWTERGYVGLALNGVAVGDEVRLVYGAGVPFIVRRCSVIEGDESSFHNLVCEAYVHGIMDGEASSFDGIAEELVILV